MTLHNKLIALADWLENPENDLIANASDKHLETLAKTLTKASLALREGASEVEEPSLTPEALDEMAAIATEFEASDDELLKKQASVLDEILLTLAAPKSAIWQSKQAEEKKIDELKKKYQDVKKELDETNKVKEAVEALNKAPVYQEARPLEEPLSTRYCPSHAGVMLKRVGENAYQCAMDGATFNFESGYTLANGKKVPGGNVNLQIAFSKDTVRMPFETAQQDSRAQRLGLKTD